jgi:molybdate-binding protein
MVGLDKDFIINLVIDQVGEEQAKNIKTQILALAEKMNNEKIYIIKRLGKRGICLITTDSKECGIDFAEGVKPNIFELENLVKDTDI